jgi:alkanesulfonate monooxygenase SsuD/methylene tetrahydromethanopterin reductase-like flavin-dependent oxidoreductase (luciferase family)
VDMVVAMAKRENLSIRQIYERFAGARGHLEVIGTPNQIADRMQEWVEAGAADGFNVIIPYFPDGLNDFVDQVIPELQRRGIFRTEYESTTLRGNLGLPQPAVCTSGAAGALKTAG